MGAEAVSFARPRLMARGALPSTTVPSRVAPRRNAAETGIAAGRTARARAMRWNLIAGAVAMAAMLLHVWTGLTVGTLGYELSRTRDLTQRLERQLNELTLENSGMMKPDLLADEARRRLGLDWPQSGQIVDLP
jgi:hypothetical protein